MHYNPLKCSYNPSVTAAHHLNRFSVGFVGHRPTRIDDVTHCPSFAHLVFRQMVYADKGLLWRCRWVDHGENMTLSHLWSGRGPQKPVPRLHILFNAVSYIDGWYHYSSVFLDLFSEEVRLIKGTYLFCVSKHIRPLVCSCPGEQPFWKCSGFYIDPTNHLIHTVFFLPWRTPAGGPLKKVGVLSRGTRRDDLDDDGSGGCTYPSPR